MSVIFEREVGEFLTYDQFSEEQCHSNEDPVKPWNSEIHAIEVN
jgi:hypothetical protein